MGGLEDGEWEGSEDEESGEDGQSGEGWRMEHGEGWRMERVGEVGGWRKREGWEEANRYLTPSKYTTQDPL